MKKKLTNNIGLKIISLLIAFSIWLVVVNIDDPVISYTYSGIPVEVINGEALTRQGMVYEIVDNTDVVSVTITGKRTVVESIGKENIKAIADVENITSMDKVEIQVFTNKNNDLLDSVKADISFVELNIENLKEVHMPISVAVNGDPQDGYVVGDVATNQNTVKISGPESVVSTVVKAEVEVNVNGRVSDITTTSDIKLYDAAGNLVDMSNISMNVKTISISATVLSTKAVEVIYSYSGTPADGYVVDGDLASDRMAVNISGRQSVLESINNIVVPASAIDVEDADKDVEVSVDLKEYLPEGVSFADQNFDGKANVTVTIAPTIQRTFGVDLDDISIVNIPAGYDASLVSSSAADGDSDETIRVVTQGVFENYTGVTAKDFQGKVDVEASLLANSVTISAGTYHILVDFKCPDGVKLVGDYYVDIKLSGE